MTLDPAFSPLTTDPRATFRRPPEGVSAQQVRDAANAWMVRHAGPAVAMSREDVRAGAGDKAIALRVYRPFRAGNAPLVMFFHGGGFVYGNLDTHDRMAARLAIESGTTVIAVDYRLAPEYPYPAPFDDCRDALDWCLANADELGIDPRRFALAGDSAGGLIALTLGIERAANGWPPRGIALFYPMVDPRRTIGASDIGADGPILAADGLAWMWNSVDGAMMPTLTDAALRRLSPVSLTLAGTDVLRGDGEALAKRLAAAGIHVRLNRYPTMPHGFAGMAGITGAADQALAEAGGDLRAYLA